MCDLESNNKLLQSTIKFIPITLHNRKVKITLVINTKVSITLVKSIRLNYEVNSVVITEDYEPNELILYGQVYKPNRYWYV
jgi:hypothetical protein